MSIKNRGLYRINRTPWGLYIVGNGYNRAGKFKIAIKMYRKGIKNNKSSPAGEACYVQLGVLYRNQGKFKEAIEVWEEGIKNNPNNIYMIKALAEIYEKQNKINKAIELYEKASVLSPQDMSLKEKINYLEKK